MFRVLSNEFGCLFKLLLNDKCQQMSLSRNKYPINCNCEIKDTLLDVSKDLEVFVNNCHFKHHIWEVANFALKTLKFIIRTSRFRSVK